MELATRYMPLTRRALSLFINGTRTRTCSGVLEQKQPEARGPRPKAEAPKEAWIRVSPWGSRRERAAPLWLVAGGSEPKGGSHEETETRPRWRARPGESSPTWRETQRPSSPGPRGPSGSEGEAGKERPVTFQGGSLPGFLGTVPIYPNNPPDGALPPTPTPPPNVANLETEARRGGTRSHRKAAS